MATLCRLKWCAFDTAKVGLSSRTRLVPYLYLNPHTIKSLRRAESEQRSYHPLIYWPLPWRPLTQRKPFSSWLISYVHTWKNYTQLLSHFSGDLLVALLVWCLLSNFSRIYDSVLLATLPVSRPTSGCLSLHHYKPQASQFKRSWQHSFCRMEKTFQIYPIESLAYRGLLSGSHLHPGRFHTLHQPWRKKCLDKAGCKWSTLRKSFLSISRFPLDFILYLSQIKYYWFYCNPWLNLKPVFTIINSRIRGHNLLELKVL